MSLIDLHRHLEGSLRVSTTLELAHRYGHPLATAEDPEDLLVAHGPLGGLLPYLDKVDAAPSAFRSLDDWRRAAREAVQDAAADGLDYLEVRFSPAFIAQETGLDATAVIDAVADGTRSASRETGLPVGLIGIVLRDLGPERGDAQMRTLLTRRDLLCGVDIAGNEAGVPAAAFAPAFALARDAGLHVTVHAGEAAGPFSVWDAVNHLGAERIGHGIRAVEDPALLDHLAAHRITLEVSLTSNLHTSTAPSYPEHPVRRLLAAGVPVALCTDDPRTSAITLSGEYQIAAPQAGLSASDLQRIRTDARNAAFA
ncbi:adenosine deaminase [Actinoplanes awajinensis]|uniref:adenosine deaminase n=1 Tax=Actinoplanes awajinensis subsp. mycoplanecinus TaxID=135947 RepID=A0A101JAD6_9ACTN|nr:adenosine deaminase [Actinoplanes awajinensis]KUL23160.1 adenosine deaminase [Actinoplanes awajinensis subsp. mycoplanecinus]